MATILAVVLGAIAVVAIVGCVVLIAEIRRITGELNYISQRDTNAQVTSSTNLSVVNGLVNAVNVSIVQNRKLRQDQIRQEQQVRSMMTNLTHDIKTPLTVAIGYVQLMGKQRSTGDGTSDGLSGLQPQELEKVEHNLQVVNHYLHYLMDFNLIQEKSSEPDLRDVDISTLVESELFEAYDQLAEHGLRLTSTVTPGVHAITDPTLLRRVVQNLIGNWLKYASEEISVSINSEVGTEGDSPHNDVVLVFSNHTPTPVENPQNLIGRFFTDDQSRSSRSTGLGLSIVDTLMHTLGGSMRLSTQKNQFRVELRLPASHS